MGDVRKEEEKEIEMDGMIKLIEILILTIQTGAFISKDDPRSHSEDAINLLIQCSFVFVSSDFTVFIGNICFVIDDMGNVASD